MDIMPLVLNLLRLISFNGIQQGEGEAPGFAPAFSRRTWQISLLGLLYKQEKLPYFSGLSRLEIY